MERYVMSLDEGTSSARAILFDRAGNVVALAQREFRQIYPRAGWVEHDASEIWSTQLSVAREVIYNAGIGADQVAAIGITNQRETCLIWDRKTGIPLSNAIVWQDRRTAGICDQLKAGGLERYVKDATGLVIDAYFSGTKLAWILDHTPGARERAARGELAGGTIDSWLIWNLTGGKVHVTDASNASRTLLFNIGTGDWDERLLSELNVPRSILPEVRDSSEVYGVTQAGLFGREVPVASSIGDQQGALFGQSCFSEGMVKATYGTGGTLLMNTGPHMRASENGLLTTVAWRLGGKLEYALEGTLFSVGSVVQWLRDELKIIHSASETELAALEVPDTNGVYIVPAFNGLSAPFWDQYARGTIVGITRGANRNHLIRASLESMAYQIRDVIGRMEADSGLALAELKVDGGAAMNNFVLQFQADQLGVRVLRPKVVDTTARGAAFLAGLAVGYWENVADLHTAFALDREFYPSNDRATADMLYRGWCRTVDRSRDWAEHE
ncbi:glycerol kinase GlpK [Rhizobium sp. IBUN]|uniref:glycerol kinase GlpK n=1 Tax=Rhizobium sp. IBUN TaxID=1042326 RepID=UPI0003FAB17A|nr:glycerol kinase GlpK [Rhizobium sp. IBUN]